MNVIIIDASVPLRREPASAVVTDRAVLSADSVRLAPLVFSPTAIQALNGLFARAGRYRPPQSGRNPYVAPKRRPPKTLRVGGRR